MPTAPKSRFWASAANGRGLILGRRSAVALDGCSSLGVDRFFAMLARVVPGPHPPWDAIWWSPRIHLVVFVHRVEGFDPGLYFLPRDATVIERVKSASRSDF